MKRIPNAASSASPWNWAWVGASLGLSLTVLVNAPAHWLTGVLRQGTQGRLLLQDPRGTVWTGSAQLTLTGGAGSTDAATLPGRTSWRIRPMWLGLRTEILADCCMQQAWQLSVRPRWGGAQLALADSLSQWPARWLTGLGTPWNTVQAEGQLSLSTGNLSVEWVAGRTVVGGRAQIDANQISSRLSTLKPMGSYRVTVVGGASPRLELSTLEGSLQLSGLGQWAGSKFRFEGVGSAAPERLDALSNLLNIIGRRDGARTIIKVG